MVFLGLQVCQPTIAGSLFRCKVNGRVEFSDRRCQPAKSTCSDRDSKEPQHGQCATPALDTSKPPVLSSAAQARTGTGVDWPGRLAFNDTAASSTESKARSLDARHDGASSQKVGSRPDAREGSRFPRREGLVVVQAPHGRTRNTSAAHPYGSQKVLVDHTLSQPTGRSGPANDQHAQCYRSGQWRLG